MPPKHRAWYACCTTVVLLSGLCFTPLVLSPGQPEPFVLGIPRTLWSAMAIAFANLLVAWLATRVHPQRHRD